MKYINLENDTYAIFDESRKRVVETIDLADAEKELVDISSRLDSIPDEPNDQVLLDWARQNMPYIRYDAEKTNLINRKTILETFINNVNEKI